MEVILLENISNLGGLGDKVQVKAGFGRNYLIPQGKAVPATKLPRRVPWRKPRAALHRSTPWA